MATLSDRPVVEVSAKISAPPGAIWRYVTDIELPARFQSEFQGAEWLDGAAPGLGAMFLGRNRTTSHSWETTSTVVVFESERAFGWAVGDPDEPLATWTFRLDATASGTTLTYHRTLGPGRSGVTRMIEAAPEQEEEIIARRDNTHRRNMAAVLEGIKQLAEGG